MSRKLIKSTAITGGMTLVSRITGLVRDIVFAGLIGAGASMAADAFYVAFRIPNFFRRIFGEGAFSQAFVPVLSEYRSRDDGPETQALVDYTTGILELILFVITLIGVIAAPVFVFVLAPGFFFDELHPEKYELTVLLLRITFPYLFFISLVALAAGILNTYRHFGVPAFTPVLLNLCLIAAALWLAPRMAEPVVALALGVFIAGVVQLLFQVPSLRHVRRLPRPRLARRHPGTSRVFKLMLPAIFGSSVAQINMLVNTLLASFLITGSVSWLYYSDRVMEFPLGVFGIALATVILPSLSRRHAEALPKEFSHLLDWALRWVFLVGFPASVGLVVLAGPILATLFQYGKFGPEDVVMTARALVAFSVGLLGFILVKVLAPGFYARQDTRTPAKIAAVSMGANIIFSLALVVPLKHVGLALGISLAAFVNAALLYQLLRRQDVYRPLPGWAPFLARTLIASGMMALVVVWGVGGLETWLEAGAMERVWRLSFWVIAGLITYVLTILLLGMRLDQLKLKRMDGARSDD